MNEIRKENYKHLKSMKIYLETIENRLERTASLVSDLKNQTIKFYK